ncbi:hypothetical protein AMEX_G4266 [Astyanax mexicanus]|uniref:Ig-like domain-containing protein n=1 Tax=Astyanax mexicanus TaxID=7994 RepID=A0A8T2MAE9_ASTMX|nr:hypothetical protein AMEX_G4266 [Astyanax mexicanus]
MFRLLLLFILHLLIGICRLCVLQEISADLRSVSPGEIITLHCSISADYEISWYHQHSEQQMKLLVSAARGKLNKSFSYSFNLNTDHFEIVENSSSVSLVIKGVNDTDLGLYHCGGRNTSSLLQFRKPIRLTFNSDEINNKSEVQRNLTEPVISENSAGCGFSWTLVLVLTCICVICVLMSILCICGFFCRMKHGTTTPSCSCCRKTREKEVDLQYATLSHEKQPRSGTAVNPAASAETVTYARVSARLSGNSHY